MAWNTLTNLADQQVVTEEHMDDIRENIEHLGSMKAWNNPLSALSGSDEIGGVTGTYTGNGGATQAITGLGFQPKMLFIWNNVDGSGDFLAIKSNQDGTYTRIMTNVPSIIYKIDHVISLDSNGFTVGDGTGDSNRMNVNSRVYYYAAYGSG